MDIVEKMKIVEKMRAAARAEAVGEGETVTGVVSGKKPLPAVDIYILVGEEWYAIKRSSYSSTSPFLSSSWEYPSLDPALPPRPGPIEAPSFSSIGSVIYSVGGFERPPKPLDGGGRRFPFNLGPITASNKVFCIDTLHPEQGWKEAPPMNAARFQAYLVSTDDDKIYAFGGLHMRLPPDPDGTRLFAEVYDPKSKAWFELARLPDDKVKQLHISVNGHAVVNQGNSDDRKILFHGYFNEELFYLHTQLPNEVGVYDGKFGEHYHRSAFLDGILYFISRQRLHAHVVSSGTKMTVDLRYVRRKTLPVRDWDGIMPASHLLSLGNGYLALIWAEEEHRPTLVHCSIIEVSMVGDTLEGKVLNCTTRSVKPGMLLKCMAVRKQKPLLSEIPSGSRGVEPIFSEIPKKVSETNEADVLQPTPQAISSDDDNEFIAQLIRKRRIGGSTSKSFVQKRPRTEPSKPSAGDSTSSTPVNSSDLIAFFAKPLSIILPEQASTAHYHDKEDAEMGGRMHKLHSTDNTEITSANNLPGKEAPSVVEEIVPTGGSPEKEHVPVVPSDVGETVSSHEETTLRVALPMEEIIPSVGLPTENVTSTADSPLGPLETSPPITPQEENAEDTNALLADFELSWERATTSEPAASPIVDPRQFEIFDQFRALMNLPLVNLSKAQWEELSNLGAELNSFSPSILSISQKAGLATLLEEIQKYAEVVSEHKSCKDSIQQLSETRASLATQANNYKALQQEIAQISVLEAHLEQQLKDLKEKKALLQQQASSKSLETKSMIKALSDSPSALFRTQQDLARIEARLDLFKRRWQNFYFLFEESSSS